MSDIAIAEATAGDFDAAIRTAESIDAIVCKSEDERALVLADRDITFREIAVAQARTGRIAESTTTLELINKDALRIRTLRDIARIQAEAKDFDGARRRLDQALAIAKPANANDQMWRIAQDQAAFGDMEGAVRWANGLASPLQRGTALIGVARGILQRGDGSGTFREKPDPCD